MFVFGLHLVANVDSTLFLFTHLLIIIYSLCTVVLLFNACYFK